MIDLYRAVKARLSALTLSGAVVPCDLGEPTENRQPPYTFVWGPLPVSESVDAASCGSELDVWVHVTYVHSTTWNTMALGACVRDLLDGWTPALTGWRCFPLEVRNDSDPQQSTAVVNGESNTYPRWGVLGVHLRATKE